MASPRRAARIIYQHRHAEAWYCEAAIRFSESMAASLAARVDGIIFITTPLCHHWLHVMLEDDYFAVADDDIAFFDMHL